MSCRPRYRCLAPICSFKQGLHTYPLDIPPPDTVGIPTTVSLLALPRDEALLVAKEWPFWASWEI